MMLKFILVIAIHLVSYDGVKGDSVSVITLELPFETYNDCVQHTKELQKQHSSAHRFVTISCSEAGKW